VARLYADAGLLDVFVIDRADESQADEIRAIGLKVVVTNTVMNDGGSRATLAREMLAAATGPGSR
jgi:LPPG:FO 2-phospho-L-lactate transferase